jgi:hypothetical protein
LRDPKPTAVLDYVCENCGFAGLAEGEPEEAA